MTCNHTEAEVYSFHAASWETHAGDKEFFAWFTCRECDAAGLCRINRNQSYTQLESSTMTLLIPDRNKENREDFVWCIPVERVKWQKWYALAEKMKCNTPMKVRYMNRMEGREVRTVVVMPNGFQSDDDAETACAWLRMVKGLNCRIYVVRCTDDPIKGAALIHAAAGIEPDQMDEIEDEPNHD